MMNALNELNNIFKYYKLTYDDILCARITYEDYDDDNDILIIKLKKNYSKSDLESFLKQLNFGYKEQYSSQKLRGIIWLVDTTKWLVREMDYEYGTQYWVLKQYPKIHEDLFEL